MKALSIPQNIARGAWNDPCSFCNDTFSYRSGSLRTMTWSYLGEFKWKQFVGGAIKAIGSSLRSAPDHMSDYTIS